MTKSKNLIVGTKDFKIGGTPLPWGYHFDRTFQTPAGKIRLSKLEASRVKTDTLALHSTRRKYADSHKPKNPSAAAIEDMELGRQYRYKTSHVAGANTIKSFVARAAARNKGVVVKNAARMVKTLGMAPGHEEGFRRLPDELKVDIAKMVGNGLTKGSQAAKDHMAKLRSMRRS